MVYPEPQGVSPEPEGVSPEPEGVSPEPEGVFPEPEGVSPERIFCICGMELGFGWVLNFLVNFVSLKGDWESTVKFSKLLERLLLLKVALLLLLKQVI